jgi:hypothetical protein
MNSDLHDVLGRIAGALGAPLPDAGTDHDRWRLYERAIESSASLDLLRQAVALEEDRTLATSVVLRILERAADDQQDDWIAQLTPENREYCKKRAAEIRILRRARQGALSAGEIASQMGDWTDWLQRRLVDGLSDGDSLAILSSQGKTKRVRNAATERLRALAK